MELLSFSIFNIGELTELENVRYSHRAGSTTVKRNEKPYYSLTRPP